MIWLTMLLAAQIQADSPTCVGSNDTVDCRSPDGSTYIERRLGDQIVRQGTDAQGKSWTEYVTPVFDGSRTVGTDSSGRTWTQHCNPRFGTTGTNRNGEAVFLPPAHAASGMTASGTTASGTTASGTTAANACG